MIPRFLLAAATALLLTACANDTAKPQAAAAAEADTAAVELHFHAIAGLNPGANGQAAPVRVRIFELKTPRPFHAPITSPWRTVRNRPSASTCWTRTK